MKQKILYLHGLSSSGQSSTAKNLRVLYPDYEILSPDLPILPSETLEMLRTLCEKECPDIIIGTSMGGMFAGQLKGHYKILVNPAFHVSEFMRTQLGVHKFLNLRQNGKTDYEITPELCDAYQTVEARQFENISSSDREKTYALFGKYDTLVHGYDEFVSHYKQDNAVWFEGEHRLNVEIIKDNVTPLIHKIMNEILKEKLLSSPLFHLSLTSKELFHSNFLAWIGETYPDVFVAILKELDRNVVAWKSKDCEIKREYNNFDLCVLRKKDQHIVLVLENKVKSIPRKSQLDEYVEKVEKVKKAKQSDDLTDYVLLSLSMQFPDRSVIGNKWKVCNYGNLCDAIDKQKNKIRDPYHLALIEDYCRFIGCLHQLASSWDIKGEHPFLQTERQTKEEKQFYQELRIGDLRDKMRHSQLCAELNKRLKEELNVQTVSGLSIKEIKEKENWELSKEVYTNWGFTHGHGLLEAKVRISNDYVLLVQLQGNRYCRGIEWIRSGSYEHWEYWRDTEKDAVIQKLSFFQFDSAADFAKFPSVCENENERIKKTKREGCERNYNKYGDRFLYQSKKIRIDATIEDVLNAVKEDIKKIIQK